MWTDNRVSPAKYVSFAMLVIYLFAAVFLFAKLRKLDVSTIVKSLVSSEENGRSNGVPKKTIPRELKNKARKLAQRYTDAITGEKNINSIQSEIKEVLPSREMGHDKFSNLMKLDGRLAMAPSIEPYFARR